jgi:hypothetical protein
MNPNVVGCSRPTLAAVLLVACGGAAAPLPATSGPPAASSGLADVSVPSNAPTSSAASSATPLAATTATAVLAAPPPHALRATDVFYIIGWNVTNAAEAQSPGVELCRAAVDCKKWLAYPEAQQVSQDFERENWVVVRMGLGQQATVVVEADQAKVQVRAECSGTQRPASPGQRIVLYRVAKSVNRAGYGGLAAGPPCRLP